MPHFCGLAEMIRYRMLLVAAGYPDGNDCDALRDDPAFKMAVGHLPETGPELCSQPTMCRLENLPTKTTLIRMMDAMVDLFCDSHYARPEAMALRSLLAASLPEIGSKASWPLMARAQPGPLYLRPRRQPRPARSRRGTRRGRSRPPRRGGRRQDPQLPRLSLRGQELDRRAPRDRPHRGDQEGQRRFIVTNLTGTPRWLYEVLYCARGQAENLIKAHKLHLASDRTSCSKATANQFRLLIHTAAYWLLHTLRGLAPKTSFWRNTQFDTLRLAFIKIAARVTEMVTRIKVSLPSSYPHKPSLARCAGHARALPP